MNNFILRIISLQALIILSTFNSFSEDKIQLDNWVTYSSMLNTISADADSKGRLWLGTNGGVYCYNPDDKSFREFRNINAMLSMDVSTITANPSSKEIFIGTFDGIIEVVTEDFRWTHLTDITKPNFPNTRINDIAINNDLAYVAGGFGLTVLDITNKVFLQTPSRLGNFQPLTNVSKVIISKGILWAATDEGVASISLSKSIINPDNWENFTDDKGLQGGKIKGIETINDEIYCFNDTNIFKFVDTGFIKVTRTEAWEVIKSIGQYNGKLTIGTLFWIRDIDDNFKFQFSDTKDSAFINGFKILPGTGEMLVMLNDAGFVILDSDTMQIKPKSPVSNLFTDLGIAPDGSLWAATDKAAGKGFMKLNNGIWENFTTKNFPELMTNNYYNVNCLPDGRTVFSSWGYGLLTVKGSEGNYNFNILNNKNSCLTGVNNAPDWVVTGQTALDKRNGSLWITNYAQNFPGPVLMKQSKDGDYFCNPMLTDRNYLTMIVDYSGTKWVGSSDGNGLFYFNEGAKPDDESDDKQGTITTSNSLIQSSNINCLAVDKSGIVWIGTPDGLAYMLSPSSVLRDANPILRQSSVKVLATLPINAIMIDALNNKWIATNQGVFVLDPDGATELMQFTTKNSSLISDEIFSLASNEVNGKIYFGSRKGLSEAQSFAIKPLESFNIKCYPQPYSPQKDGNLTIEGLAADADIRIVTTDGTLVKAMQTGSQKLIWDGRDESGQLVRSGVYLIIGNSLSTDASAIGKIAIIND